MKAKHRCHPSYRWCGKWLTRVCMDRPMPMGDGFPGPFKTTSEWQYPFTWTPMEMTLYLKLLGELRTTSSLLRWTSCPNFFPYKRSTGYSRAQWSPGGECLPRYVSYAFSSSLRAVDMIKTHTLFYDFWRGAGGGGAGLQMRSLSKCACKSWALEICARKTSKMY